MMSLLFVRFSKLVLSWQSLRLLGVVLIGLGLLGPSVNAETDGAASNTFFLRERQNAQVQRLQPQRAPRPAAARAVRRIVPQFSGGGREYYGAPAAASAPAATPPAPPSLFVAVLGDSLGVLMAQGLQEAYGERPDIAVLRKAKESSGLVRDDFYDWQKASADMLAGPERIDVAIMIVGSNDRQEMPDKISPQPFRATDGLGISGEFLAKYGNRVEALAALFRERRVPLIWVGMPVMKNERMSAELYQFNEIYRTRAAKAGAVYIDVWEAFVNDSSKFDTFGPDLNGEIVKLRTSDGIHFTKAGARKLAHFVEAEVKRVLDGLKATDLPQIAALPGVNPSPEPLPHPLAEAPSAGIAAPIDLDINALLRRQMGDAINSPKSPDLGEILAALPLPAEPAPLYLPQRPLAGPIAMLTAAPLAAGGELANRRGRTTFSTPADEVTDSVFASGRLPPPRPGRSDSFIWPRP